jgi:hypothetical protein
MNWSALQKGLLVALALHVALAVVIGWALGVSWLGMTYGPWAVAGGCFATTAPIVVFVVYKAETRA